MKKSFSQILSQLDAQELDQVLDGIQPEPMPQEASASVRRKVLSRVTTEKPLLRRLTAIAACIVLLIGAGFGTYAYAAEAREYRQALEFFTANDLSTDGLSRADIKAVYRDITTESFTYGKTAQVIAQMAATKQIPGWELLQKEPSQMEVAGLFQYYRDNGWCFIATQSYKPDSHYTFQDVESYGSYCELVTKYEGVTQIWQIEIPDVDFWGSVELDDGVILHGRSHANGTLIKLRSDSSIAWQHDLGTDVYVQSVFRKDDGSIVAIGKPVSQQVLQLDHISADGTLLDSFTVPLESGILDAAAFGDGYVLYLGSRDVVMLDAQGTVTATFTYSQEGTHYYVADMMEYDGMLYLSCYAVEEFDGKNYGNREEIARILDYAFSQEAFEIPSEELTPVVRSNYTAVLLVCDPNGGEPQQFYQVPQALGGELSRGESGQLQWDTESIVSTFFSPATNAFSIGGLSFVYRYSFDSDGQPLGCRQTGEVAPYYR